MKARARASLLRVSQWTEKVEASLTSIFGLQQPIFHDRHHWMQRRPASSPIRVRLGGHSLAHVACRAFVYVRSHPSDLDDAWTISEAACGASSIDQRKDKGALCVVDASRGRTGAANISRCVCARLMLWICPGVLESIADRALDGADVTAAPRPWPRLQSCACQTAPRHCPLGRSL